jgi:hypothetical protein
MWYTEQKECEVYHMPLDDDLEVLTISDDVSRETSPLTPPLLTFRYKCDECGYVAHELTGHEIVLTHNYVYTYLVPMYSEPCSGCQKNYSYAGHITLATERE